MVGTSVYPDCPTGHARTFPAGYPLRLQPHHYSAQPCPSPGCRAPVLCAFDRNGPHVPTPPSPPVYEAPRNIGLALP